MATINIAYTAPVNPPGATPVVTRAQMWAGFQHKVLHPEAFVPAIESCRVLEEKENEVIREATLKSQGGVPGLAGGVIKEICKSYPPTKVDYHRTSGAVISNVISDGPSLADDDIYVTFTYEWRHDDIEAGSAREKELIEEHRKGGKRSVDSSIEATRRMVRDGVL